MYLENIVDRRRRSATARAVLGGGARQRAADRRACRLRDATRPSRADHSSTCASRASPSRLSNLRDCTWTSWAGPARPTRSNDCSDWAHDTSTSVSATCPGWCSPTRRAIPAASWRSGRRTPTPDPSRRSRSTLPIRAGMRTFWSWLTGWTEAAGVAPRSLRHPSLRGPLLELCSEPAPKRATKNRLHLDVRLEAGEDPDDAAAGIAEHGGRELPVGGRPAVAALRRPVGQRVLRTARAGVRVESPDLRRTQSTYADIHRSISAYAAARGSGSDSTTSWRAPSMAT